MEDGGDKEFIHEEVVKIVEDAINNTFGIKEGKEEQIVVNVNYNKDKINSWCNHIMDNVIRNLSKLNKPFKYCVTTVIQQNNKSGLFTAGCGYYDNNTDGIIGITKEINDIIVITSVYAMVI